MTVNVSKPAINVREKLAELDKPTGIAGEAMLRAETPQEQFNLIGAGRRNLIINGAMEVWQRGTSFSVANSNVYTADRMYAVAYNLGFIAPTAGTISQNTIYSTTLDGVTFKNSLRITPNSTWKLCYLHQRLEDVTKLSDVTVTVSYYMRADTTGSYNHQERVNQVFGSGGSATVSTTNPHEYRHITTEWQRFEHQIHIPSIAGKTVGSGSYFDFYIFNADNLSNFGWIEVTGFQVELGKVATPFEHRSYGEELALCQRYYYSSPTIIGFAMVENNDYFRGWATFPVTMRAAPTITESMGSATFYDAGNSRSFTTVAPSGATNIGYRHSVESSTASIAAYQNTWSYSADAEL